MFVIVTVTVISLLLRYGHSLLEEARRDNLELWVVLPLLQLCALATRAVVLFREELLLTAKQEMAAITAEYEQDKQMVGWSVMPRINQNINSPSPLPPPPSSSSSQWQLKELQHEEEVLKLQEQLQAQLTAAQKWANICACVHVCVCACVCVFS